MSDANDNSESPCPSASNMGALTLWTSWLPCRLILPFCWILGEEQSDKDFDVVESTSTTVKVLELEEVLKQVCQYSPAPKFNTFQVGLEEKKETSELVPQLCK